MKSCPACKRQLPEVSRYCIQCGQRLNGPSDARGDLNVRVLYGMAAILVLALLFPPWETPPTQQPEFLGMHFILDPPAPDAVVSRLLLTIELVTIAIAGLYGSFLFRKR